MSQDAILLDQKREYTKHLCKVIIDPMIKGFRAIYREAKESRDAKANGILHTFQARLENVPNWNNVIIAKEYDRLNCSFFADLLKATFITNGKLALHNVSGGKGLAAAPKLNVPSPQHFLHKCYIGFARVLWQWPYLMSDTLKPVEQQQNLRQCHLAIKDVVKEVLYESLPLDDLYKQVSQQSVALPEEDEEEEEEDDEESDEEEEEEESDEEEEEEDEEEEDTDEDDAEEKKAEEKNEDDEAEEKEKVTSETPYINENSEPVKENNEEQPNNVIVHPPKVEFRWLSIDDVAPEPEPAPEPAPEAAPEPVSEPEPAPEPESEPEPEQEPLAAPPEPTPQSIDTREVNIIDSRPKHKSKHEKPRAFF